MRRDSDTGKLGVRLAAVAIIVAPFIALVYRAEAGLFVMAIALGAVSMLLREAIDAAPQHARSRVRLLVGFNLMVAGACLALVVWLIVRR